MYLCVIHCYLKIVYTRARLPSHWSVRAARKVNREIGSTHSWGLISAISRAVIQNCRRTADRRCLSTHFCRFYDDYIRLASRRVASVESSRVSNRESGGPVLPSSRASLAFSHRLGVQGKSPEPH